MRSLPGLNVEPNVEPLRLPKSGVVAQAPRPFISDKWAS